MCSSSSSTAQGPQCWALCCCAQRRGRCLLLRHSPHRASSLPESERYAAALKARHPSQCPPFMPRVRCGPTLPPVASPHLQCGPLKSPPAGGHHRAPKRVKRYSGPLRGAVMRRRAGQCWGLCSARCASHRPQQGRRCPSGRHARPPPGQAVQHARRSVPPSPPLLSKVGQGWPLALPSSTDKGQALQHRQVVKAATLPKRNAACGRECHSGERNARPRQAACGGPCVAISGVAGTKQGRAAPVAAHRQPTHHRKEKT